ncbi:MAG: hypothetical protein CBC40_00390 [bacterium TMED80]|nr:cytochrome C biogenesis protein [Rhodobiaceae bacterium]OUV06138.1 MAG: hypothetical protein CBC40_00390 [bacterium TMED80]RZO33836.1 MAG: cytochrome c biogenesis protein CcdA [Hyphomicrobiales bacterium]
MDTFFILAFIAGILSFLSPCVLPIVPSYLCFLTGASLVEIRSSDSFSLRKSIIVRSVFFVLGFSLIFIGLGASATLLRPILNFNIIIFDQNINLRKIAGLIIIFFGLHMIGIYKFQFLNRQLGVDISSKRKGISISFLMGTAFAFGWTPCIGPILSTILTLASVEETITEGVLLLTFYSLGLGIPFIISSFLVNHLIQFIKKFKTKYFYLEISMGIIMIFTGLAFIFGWIEEGAFFLLENFSILSKFGI